MKKIIYALFLLFTITHVASANVGDTTWVQSHNTQKLDYYNNFDSAVVFPSASKSYRKIYMIFTMGKYVCPGSPQYCGDWDYTVQNIVMTPRGDTFELGRLMTPYAHSGVGPFTASWKHRYIFDVTDNYPVLRDSATMRIHYSGYSGGFTASIQFMFIEGTPERNVLGVDHLWQRDYDYGHGSVSIDTAMGTLHRSAPTGTVSAEMKMNITGHGGDDNGCSEFCPNSYALTLNNNQLLQQDFYRTNCDKNDLYPQSGTWIYPRANWCPGALVNTFRHVLPGVAAGSNYSVAMTFPPYTSTTVNPNTFAASYTIAGTTVYYGAFNNATDASIEDIVSPTNAEWHYRANPHVGKPVITVRNSGSTAITSIRLEYGLVGRTPLTYTWTGSLASLQNQDITLPVMDDLKLDVGTYQFSAKILAVNGQADGNSYNDQLTSTFTAAANWPTDVIMQLKANNGTNGGGVSQTAWRIEDMSGNVVAQKSDCGISTICLDTISLPYGFAYRLIVSDEIDNAGFYDIGQAANVPISFGDGLNFFSSSTGYVRAYDLYNAVRLPMPAEITGTYEGNFGGGFVYDFYTGDYTTGVHDLTARSAEIYAYPNPATNQISVLINGLQNPQGKIEITDMTGRKILSDMYVEGH